MVYPIVIPPIDIPLDVIPISLRSKRPEPMTLRDFRAELVRLLLVLLVVTVIGVEQVSQLADLVLHVHSLNLEIRRMHVVNGDVGFLEFVSKARQFAAKAAAMA